MGIADILEDQAEHVRTAPQGYVTLHIHKAVFALAELIRDHAISVDTIIAHLVPAAKQAGASSKEATHETISSYMTVRGLIT